MDGHKESTVSSLKIMGFDPDLIEKAYARSDIKTVEGLINYIEAHPNLQNEPDIPAGNTGDHNQQAGGAQESPGESISGHVNQAQVAELTQLGHSKDVAEKALFMTQGAGVAAAKEWIDEHRYDPDFNEPLFIVRQNANAPKLTPEEAKKKAKELQAKIREERAKKDQQAEHEAEIARLKSGKGLTQAQRDLEELKTQLEIQQFIKDRDETEAAKRKILEQIEKDRIARGLKPTTHVHKPIKEIFPEIVKKMQRVYTDPEIVKTCVKTIGIYLSKF